jgi:Uncharacterized conserved protein (COG2071)
MHHLYTHPHQGAFGNGLAKLFNSRRFATYRRAAMSRLPFMTLDSDVVDVVYMNWLVDEALAAPFAPPGARLWSHQGRTPLTVLTYRHGHFGPRWMGPLRRWMPSPLQSNWRLYLAEPLADAPPIPTVAFVYNMMDSLAYVAGTRLFSDALPSHWPARFDFRVTADEAIIGIAPGDGSAPRLVARAARGARAASQDAAVVEVPTVEGAPARSALATIALPVDAASVEPLLLDTQTLDCPLLQRLDADPEALCFLLHSVRFSALSERLLRASA